MTTSPGYRVAHIPELLEAILLHLATNVRRQTYGYRNDCSGLSTILISQSTCTAFRDTIAGFAKLQQALFLALPQQASAEWEKDNPFAKSLGCSPHTQCVASEDQSLRFVINARIEGVVHPTLLWLPAEIGDDKQSMKAEPSWKKMYLMDQQYEVISIWSYKYANYFKIRLSNPTLGDLADAVALEYAVRWWREREI